MWKKSLNRILLSFIVLPFIGPATFAGMVEDQMRFAKKPNQGLSYQHQRQIDQYQYIFIGGYMNEAVRNNYFKINAATIESLGASEVKIYFPSSARATQTSALEIRNLAYREFEAGGHRPIIFIPHSMAGISTIGAILLDPELVTKGIVKKIVAVQSPLTGNDLADQQSLIKQFMTLPLNGSAGFYSLQTPQIQDFIEKRIQELPRDLRNVLSDSVSFVISKTEMKTASTALRAGSILLPYRGDYDGLVARINMWTPDFGTILGDISADHLELVLGHGLLVGKKFSPAIIEAFTKSLIVNILKSLNNSADYRKLTKAISCQKVSGEKQ